ncbi:alpha-2-macroglobulin family protein [Candidatus Tisiphia endosymbiont of Beris chalybata]
MPDYFNGTIRVMAVASNQEAIGSTAETTLVQGEFVISPNLPLFACHPWG